MIPRRIGREILNKLPPEVFPIPDGRKVRPLHTYFEKQAILDEAQKGVQESTEIFSSWDKNLDITFASDADRTNWAERIVRDEMLPTHYESILQSGLKKLVEVLKKPTPEKRANFVLLLATSAPVLSYAVKPVLESAGVQTPFFAFPRTHRASYPDELDLEDQYDRERASGKKPQETARERFLTVPPRPKFTDSQRSKNAYLDKKEAIEEYIGNKRHILIDLSRQQLDFQTRQELALWHEKTGQPIDECRPLIIDDFVSTEGSIRDTIRSLQRGGVKRKNITAFSFMSYDEPENWVTNHGIHVGAAVYNESRFPFAEHTSQYPPLTGTFKRTIENGYGESAYINIDNLQQPWQEPIHLQLSENSRKNYAALLKALRHKLRENGEKVASEL